MTRMLATGNDIIEYFIYICQVKIACQGQIAAPPVITA